MSNSLGEFVIFICIVTMTVTIVVPGRCLFLPVHMMQLLPEVYIVTIDQGGSASDVSLSFHVVFFIKLHHCGMPHLHC